MRQKADFSLYLVTDKKLAGGRPMKRVVEAAVRGGVTAVQLREKKCSTREFVDLARRLLSVLRPHRVPLLINDRIDIALASGADGVHLGQSDVTWPEARRLLGPQALIGLTVETAAQALEAEKGEVDYFGVSPIFSTPTKTDTGSPWGLEGLRRLRRTSKKVLVAIGGINEGNASRVLEAGADAVAVVSAICAADDPEAAARRLRKIVDEFRKTCPNSIENLISRPSRDQRR